MNDEPDRVALPRSSVVATIQHLLAVGQKARAQELAATLVAGEPTDPGAQVTMGFVLLALDDVEGARAAADEALMGAPDSDWVHALQASVALQQGRFDDAERFALEAIRLDAEDADHHLLYARILSSCDRDRLALEAAYHATQLAPDDPEAHRLMALLLLHCRPKHWPLPAEAARRAIQLDPEDADAHAIMGMIHLRERRLGDAEERFRAALLLDPHQRLALRGLAQVVMARSWFYGLFLRYPTLMARLDRSGRMAVVVGLWAFFTSVTAAMRGSATLSPYAEPVSTAYLLFCGYTWFAEPITGAILGRSYPWLAQARRG